MSASENKTLPDAVIPAIPEHLDRIGNGASRRLGQALLRLMGWRLVGEIPKHKQLVMAAAPHTSNWDFILAMLAVLATGIRISYLMKKEAFFWPLRSCFLWLGGIPIDRSAAENTVDQIATWFQRKEKLWVVITPEGTRSKVKRWKTGFLRLAQKVDVPVLLVVWDYPNKCIRLETQWQTTGDHEFDANAIREYIDSRYKGRHAHRQ